VRVNSQANARLIAAAPDMLATLEHVHAWVRKLRDPQTPANILFARFKTPSLAPRESEPMGTEIIELAWFALGLGWAFSCLAAFDGHLATR